MKKSASASAALSFRVVRTVLAVALVCAYPILAHVSVAAGEPRFAQLAWLCLAGLVGLAMPGRWGIAVAAALVLPLFLTDAEALLRAPPVLVNVALGVWFGRSLMPHEEPMISWFARLERGELEPELARYSRCLTAIWTGFFAVMAITSAALAVAGSAETWSVFTNGVNYLLVALLFIGEYAYRRIRYSHYRHASLPRLVRMLMSARGRPRRAAPE